MKAIVQSRKFVFGSLVLFFALTILAACQSGPPQITISNAKATLSPAIIGEAMVTMDIVNQGGSDVLTGVNTDIPGATVMIHIMQGKRMVATDTVDVKSKSTLEFKMGGSHVMIQNMPKNMKKGSKFNLTLIFEKSGEKTLPLTLGGAMSMPMGHDHHM
jgi:copper(I)-binding protein